MEKIHKDGEKDETNTKKYWCDEKGDNVRS